MMLPGYPSWLGLLIVSALQIQKDGLNCVNLIKGNLV